jgi:hypothetical protein
MKGDYDCETWWISDDSETNRGLWNQDHLTRVREAKRNNINEDS